jgi:hypothetical protein
MEPYVVRYDNHDPTFHETLEDAIAVAEQHMVNNNGHFAGVYRLVKTGRFPVVVWTDEE